jgi:multidrug efflux pump subunit AcrA (membrane-fusion protein)
VQVSITSATAKAAVLVPEAAVFESPEAGSFVMLAGKDGLAHQTAVQVGLRGPAEAQITKGVSAGDSVIVSGAYGLPDKTRIRIEAPQPAESGKPEDRGEKAKEKSPSAPEKE